MNDEKDFVFEDEGDFQPLYIWLTPHLVKPVEQALKEECPAVLAILRGEFEGQCAILISPLKDSKEIREWVRRRVGEIAAHERTADAIINAALFNGAWPDERAEGDAKAVVPNQTMLMAAERLKFANPAKSVWYRVFKFSVFKPMKCLCGNGKVILQNLLENKRISMGQCSACGKIFIGQTNEKKATS